MWVIKTGFIMMIYNSFELFLKPGKRFVFKSHLLASEKKKILLFYFFWFRQKLESAGPKIILLKNSGLKVFKV